MGAYGLADILYRNPSSRPGSEGGTALVFEDREWTYPELSDEVERLATGLAVQGMKAGDRCAILLYNRPEYVTLYFALAHLGAVAVPLNYFLKAPEISYALTDSACSWLVTEPPLWDGACADIVTTEHAEVRVVDCDAQTHTKSVLSYSGLLADGAGPRVPIAPTRTDDMFLLQYTSGTTGFPKAAIHTHGNVLFSALTQIVDFRITANDVHLVIPALCWGAGFNDYTIATWWQGGTVVLRRSGGFTGDEVCEVIARHHVSTVLFVPSVLRLVISSPLFSKETVGSLRVVLCGGEHVPVGNITRFQDTLPDTDFVQGYGLTEFPVIAAFLDGSDAIPKRGSTGKASMSVRLRVVNAEGADVVPGEIGEIICRSPATTLGYLGKPEATGTAFVDGWLHTGDRGTVDEDGFLTISGRVKDMIISGGLNVYPREIERVLETHPNVIEAAVVAVPDERYQEVGRAIVVISDPVAVEDLQQLCRDELANFKVPKHWELRTEPLPRTNSGKVQKFLLQSNA
jgi:fatty-acyl-CoA synthase